MKKSLLKYILNIGLIVLFTFLILYFSLKNNYREVISILKHVDLKMVLVVFVIVMIYELFIGLALKLLANISKSSYTLFQGFLNALIASFFHSITPSASGGQVAQVYVFKKQGIDLSDSASILWMDFILYQSSMVLTVFVLLLLKFNYYYTYHSNFFFLVIIGFIVNSAIIIGLYLIAHYKKFYVWVSTKGLQLAHRFKLVKDIDAAKITLNTQLERFDHETKRLKSNYRILILVVIVNILRQIVYYSIPFFCAKALGIPISINLFIDSMALASFVSMINCFIPIPGASGGTEATFILMFSTILTRGEATSTMILWRFSTFYLIILVGGIVFMLFKLSDYLQRR